MLRKPAVITWLRLARIVQHIDHTSESQLRRRDLNLAQFDVLAHVGAAEGITQQELADTLLVTKGNVCQLLGRMEANGLIWRSPQGRSNHVYLTDAGRALFQQVVPEHEDQIAAAFTSLTAGELHELQRLLHKLERDLRRTGATH
jgi:DNA-binding MarR family transcriptional regulator